ncbi:class I SAM-dependent methyltransferase [Ignatzschineria sp. LJL83]
MQFEKDINSEEEQFPEPSHDEYALSAKLAFELVSEIREAGSIPFSRFFNQALYHPTYGYYTGPQAVFGREGDFITAPLISDVFSKSLGNQIMEIAGILKDDYQILEIGAGNGTMAKDILLHLAEHHQLPEKYLILEVSPNLRERQKALISQALPEYIENVEWIAEPPKIAWKGVIVANEVIDALSVERFRIFEGDIHYVDVGLEVDEIQKTVSFTPVLRKADAPLLAFRQDLAEKGIELPEGYESEYCPSVKTWLAPFFEHLTEGVVLFIDYGYDEKEYYRPERTTGTLIAHYKHRAHEDFYLYPGLQDLTANVNFTDVATILVDMGLEFLGYTTQSYFLLGNKLQEIVAKEKMALEEAGENELAWFELSKRVQHLIHPEEMGERFKVLAVGKNFDHALQGFELQDYAHHL